MSRRIFERRSVPISSPVYVRSACTPIICFHGVATNFNRHHARSEFVQVVQCGGPRLRAFCVKIEHGAPVVSCAVERRADDCSPARAGMCANCGWLACSQGRMSTAIPAATCEFPSVDMHFFSYHPSRLTKASGENTERKYSPRRGTVPPVRAKLFFGFFSKRRRANFKLTITSQNVKIFSADY